MIQHIYKILNEGKREYSNNKIFSLIDKLIATINGVPSLIELYLAISEDKVEGLDTPRDAIVISNSDSRIMHLMVSAFKGFPKADKTFGIDFRDVRENNKPSSTVILGSNGIGKTSIYTALEMVSMNHSYIGDIYGYNTQLRQQAFVRNVDSLYEHLLVKMIDFSGNERTYPSLTTELCPRAFFCSQFDIQEYQCNGMSKDYVFNQLGRYKLYALMIVVNDFELITKKMNEALRLDKENSQQTEEIFTQIKSLQDEVREMLGLSKIELVKYQWADDEMVEHIKEVAQVIRNEVERTFKEFSRVSTELIPKMINDYLKEDHAKVFVKTEGNTITPLIVKEDSLDGIEPRLWFNTFRMKLFIVAMKMSLAFTIKILDNFNFPIVMDDVFDSSDFINKFEIRRFFHSIMLGHDENDSLKRLPLQIICFTQDRLIGDNVYQAILQASSRISIKYCRMFHYREVTEDDLVLENKINYYNITQYINSSI